MAGVNVGNLYRKRTVRRMSGEIIDMSDEADGGIIISKGVVVNQEKINELAAIERDKQTALAAPTAQVASTNAEDRVLTPSEATAKNTKVEELEKRMDNQDAKLDAILAALKK